MKLLFDQNLSPRLVAELTAEYPGSQHVRSLGLAAADDLAIWELARREDYVIVSKDADFHQRSFLFGHPPKVVWVRLGNCSTADILSLLRRSREKLQGFMESELGAFLILP